MYVTEYQFKPNDTAYVVIDRNKVREARVLKVDIRVYKKENFVVEDVTYFVLLLKDNDSVRVEPDLIFSNINEAFEKVKEKLNGSDLPDNML